MNKQPQNNIQWRNLGIVFIGLTVLWLIFNQLSAANNGIGYGHMGHMNFYVSSGPTFQGLLLSIFVFAFKVLWVLLLVAVAIGLFQMARQYVQKGEAFNLNSLGGKPAVKGINCPSCGENLQEDFKFCPSCKASLKRTCSCGKELQADWKCCPNCGKEVTK